MAPATDAATLGLLLVALAFGILALNLPWAEMEDEDGAALTAFGISQSFFGETTIHVEYSEAFFDDMDGIGQVRAGGVLLLVGTITVGVGALAAEHALLLRQPWLSTAAGAVALAGLAVLTTAVVLLPLGLVDLTATLAEGEPAGLSWRFGLYAGIVAAALALGAVVTAAIAVARGAGLRLEPAADVADFDD